MSNMSISSPSATMRTAVAPRRPLDEEFNASLSIGPDRRVDGEGEIEQFLNLIATGRCGPADLASGHLDVLLQAAGRSFGTQAGETTSAFGERSWAAAIEGPWRDRFEQTTSSSHAGPEDCGPPFSPQRGKSPPPASLRLPPPDVRVGVSLFVRLLRKGAKGHNADGLRRMAPQLPTLLANLPPMALAGCPAAPRRKARNAAEGEEEQDEEDEQEDDEGDDDKEATVDRDNTGLGVPDLLDRLLRRLLSHTDNETAQDERGGLLTSLVGLAVKRGSTPKVLEAIRTVLQYGGGNTEVDGTPSLRLSIEPFLADLRSLAPTTDSSSAADRPTADKEAAPDGPWPLQRWREALTAGQKRNGSGLDCASAALCVLLALAPLSLTPPLHRRLEEALRRRVAEASGETDSCLKEPLAAAFQRLAHRPFALDGSEDTGRLLFLLLREACGGVIRERRAEANQTHDKAELGKARPTSSKSNHDGSDASPNVSSDKNNGGDGHDQGSTPPYSDGREGLQAWVLIWSVLRLLRAWLPCSAASSPCLTARPAQPREDDNNANRPPVDESAVASEDGDDWDMPGQKAAAASPVGDLMSARRAPRPSVTMQRLRVLLLQLCVEDLALGLTNGEEEGSACHLLRVEAALALSEGFSLFYPTVEARVALLCGLADAPSNDRDEAYVLPAMAERLARGDVMAAAVARLSRTGGWAAPEEERGPQDHEGQEEELFDLLTRLLRRCAEAADSGQGTAQAERCKVLAALHRHVLWSLSDRGAQPLHESRQLTRRFVQHCATLLAKTAAALGDPATPAEQITPTHRIDHNGTMTLSDSLTGLKELSRGDETALGTHLAPPLLTQLAALPPPLLSAFASLVSPAFKLLHAIQDSTQGQVTGPLLSAATAFVGAVASGLAFGSSGPAPLLLKDGMELPPCLCRDDAPLVQALMQSDSGRTLDMEGGLDPALLDLRRATQEWHGTADGGRERPMWESLEDAPETAEKDRDGPFPQRRHSSALPLTKADVGNGSGRPVKLPKGGSHPRLLALPSLPQPSQALVPNQATRPSTASSSGRPALSHVMEQDELQRFLADLVEGRGQALALDSLLLGLVEGELAAVVPEPPAEAGLRVLRTTLGLSTTAKETGTQGANGAEPDGRDERLRRSLTCLLLQSHDLVTQASLASRCLPQPPASPALSLSFSAPSPISPRSVSPAIRAVWRTAVAVARHLHSLSVTEPSRSKACPCSDHGSQGHAGCTVTNLAILLRAAGHLPPIGLVRESPHALVQKSMRRLSRACPRADTQPLATALITIENWSRAYDWQQQPKALSGDAARHPLLRDASPDAPLPLSHLLSFLLLPCPASQQLLSRLTHVRLRSDLHSDGLLLTAKALGDTTEGPALLHLLRRFTSTAAAHLRSLQHGQPTPRCLTQTQARGTLTACLLLFQRLFRLLQTHAAALSDVSGDVASKQEGAVGVLLALSAALLLFQHAAAARRRERNGRGTAAGLRQTTESQAPRPLSDQPDAEDPVPALVTALRRRLLPLLSHLLTGAADAAGQCPDADSVANEWASLRRRGAEGADKTSESKAFAKLRALQALLDRKLSLPAPSQSCHGAPRRSGHQVLHDATWHLLSLASAFLTDAADGLAPAGGERDNDIPPPLRASSARTLPLPGTGVSTEGLQLVPRPSSAASLQRRASLPTPGPTPLVDIGFERAAGGRIVDVLRSELTRLLPLLTDGLCGEKRLLELLLRNRPHLVIHAPPRTFDVTVSSNGEGDRPACRPCRVSQLRQVDDFATDFSVGLWLHRPTPPSTDSQAPDKPAVQPRRVLFARALETAFPSQASELGEKLPELLDMCHPGIFLSEGGAQEGGKTSSVTLEVSVLVPELGPQGASAGSRGREGMGSRSTIGPRGGGLNGNNGGLTVVPPASGYGRRYTSVRLSVALDDAMWGPDGWVHLCCTYASEVAQGRHSDCSAREDEGDATASARLCIFVNGRQVGVKEGLVGHVTAPLCTDLVLSDAADPSDTPDKPRGRGPSIEALPLRVVDLCYFQRAMAPDDAETAVGLGPLSAALGRRRMLRRYILRLLGAVHNAVKGRGCVPRFATQPWVSLLLSLARVGDTAVQTSIVRLLRVLLPASQAGSGTDQTKQEELLSELLSLYKSSHLLPFHLSCHDEGPEASGVEEQGVGATFCVSVLRDRLLQGQADMSAPTSPGGSRRGDLDSQCLQLARLERDYEALASELTSLLRGLWRVPAWRELLNGRVTQAANGYKSDEAGDVAPLLLVLGVLGGHMEGVRVGGSVLVSCHDQSGEATGMIKGTVLGISLSPVSTSDEDGSQGATTTANVHIVPSKRQSQGAPSPLTCPLPDVMVADDVAPLSGDGCVPPTLLLSLLSQALTLSPSLRQEMPASPLSQQVQAAALRASALRCLAAQLSLDHTGTYLVTPLLESKDELLPRLLDLATSDPCAGNGFGPTGPRARALAARLSGDGLSEDWLHAFSRLAWSRWVDCLLQPSAPGALYSLDPPLTPPRECQPACLAGDAAIEPQRVRALSHFPSIGLTSVSLSVPGNGSQGGRWFYEVLLLTDGLMQIGWASPSFRCDPVCGQGVGDHTSSWSFDGFRMKKWCVSSSPYGARWRAGDVLGVLLDLDLHEMRFYLNGTDLGPAFVGFTGRGLFPAASLNVGQAARFNFGQSPFIHPPSAIDGLPFRPVGEAARAGGQWSESRGGDGSETDKEGRSREASQDARRLSQTSSRGGEEEGQGRDRRDTNATEDSEEEEGQGSLQNRRRALIESLMGMGFPVEWAIRAVEHCDGSMSESMAIAWIIERMEMESARLDAEIESANGGRRGNGGAGGGSAGNAGQQRGLGLTGEEYEESEAGADSARGRHRSENESIAAMSVSALSQVERAVERRLPASGGAEERVAVDEDAFPEAYFPVPADRSGEAPGSSHRGSEGERAAAEHVSTAIARVAASVTGTELQDVAEEANSTGAVGDSMLTAEGLLAAAEKAGVIGPAHPPGNTPTRAGEPDFGERDWEGLVEGASAEELMHCVLLCHVALAVVHARHACRRLLQHAASPGTEPSAAGPRPAHVPLVFAQDAHAIRLPPPLAGLLSPVTSTPTHRPLACRLLLRTLDTPTRRAAFLRLLCLLHATHTDETRASLPWFPRAGDPATDVEAATWRALRTQIGEGIAIGATVRVEGGEGLVFAVGEPTDTDNPGIRALTSLLTEAGRFLWDRPGVPETPCHADSRSAASAFLGLLGTDLLAQAEAMAESTLRGPDCGFLASLWSALLNVRRGLLMGKAAPTSGAPVAALTPSEQGYVQALHGLVAPQLYKSLLDASIRAVDLGRRLSLLRLCAALLSHVASDNGATPADQDSELRLKEYLCVEREKRLAHILAGRLRKETEARVLHSAYVQALVSVLVLCLRLRRRLGLLPTPEGEDKAPHAALEPLTPDAEGPERVPQLFIEEVGSTSIILSWAGKRPGESSASSSPLSTAGRGGWEADEPTPLVLQQCQRGLWGCTDFVDVASLPLLGRYTLEGLQPDCSYMLRLVPGPPKPASAEASVTAPSEPGLAVTVATSPERLFVLDGEAMGENLQLSNGGLTVRNVVNKRWSSVRGTSRFRSGCHSWGVRVDRCVSKNIFIGVCTAEGALDNYVGSDRFGWGYLANKAVWHNKSKARTYGELFREGDVITVHLNLDAGTLSFDRNGRSLGVAVEGLRGEYYPALSLYNRDDQLTLLPHDKDGDNQDSNASPPNGGTASAECVVQRLCHALELLDALPSHPSISPPGKPELTPTLVQEVRQRWLRWQRGGSRFVETAQGRVVEVDTSSSTCAAFAGLSTGDYLRTRRGTARVVGAENHRLWLRMDDVEAVSAFSLSRREVLELMGEQAAQPPSVLLASSARYMPPPLSGGTKPDTPGGSSSPVSPELTDARCATTSELTEWFASWTPEMDAALADLVDQCARRRHVSPLDLSPSDLPTDPGLAFPGLRAMPAMQVRARTALLLHANALLLPLLPYTDLLEGPHATTQWARQGRPFQACNAWSIGSELRRHRFRLFSHVKARLLTRLLASTSDPPPRDPETEPTGQAPVARLRLHFTAGLGPEDTVFEQVARQLEDLPEADLRRRSTDLADIAPHWQEDGTPTAARAACAFAVDVEEGPEGKEDKGQGDEGQQHRDPEAMYRYTFYRLGQELQEPGLLCPSGTEGGELTPSLAFLMHAGEGEGIDLARLSRLRTLGQVMGLALRTGVALPLHLSDGVWRRLVEHEGEATEALDPLTTVCRLLAMDGVVTSMPEQGLRMVAPLSNGRMVPLDTGAPVLGWSAETVAVFVRRARALSAAESLPSVSALFAGLTSVVPMHLLPILTPPQLRELVCGGGRAYVRLLRDWVVYRDGCGERHRAVQLFWSCLECMPVSNMESLVKLFLASPSDPQGLPDRVWVAFTPEAGPLHYGIRIDGPGRTIWLQDDLTCTDKIRRSFERALTLALPTKT